MITRPHRSLAFGALALRPGGSGVQTYEREVISAVAAAVGERHLDLELSAVAQEDASSELPAAVGLRSRSVSSGARRALEGLRRVSGVDLFHGLDVDLPAAQRGATVSTVHDMSAFDTPWAMSRVRALGERRLLGRSLGRADEIIAVSEFTAERVHALVGRECRVIPLAPAPWARVPSDAEVSAVRKKYDLPERCVFQLATLEPRKQPGLVADALRTLPGSVPPLVLAGARTDSPERPAGSIGLGYVDLEDVPALYRAATVVAYASSYEGFGLPPVEAMACGAVVVASDAGAIRESTDGGALVVESGDVSSWAEALRGAIGDEDARSALLARGAQRSAELSWSVVGEATVDVYERLL